MTAAAPSALDGPAPVAFPVAARLAALVGWRRHAAAAGFGVLATLALPPAQAAPLLWIAFPALLWLVDGCRSTRSAFWTGWWFGLAHHLFGLYWIAGALFVDIASFWWALPLAAGGLPVVLAVFVGAGTALLHRSGLRGSARVLAFAGLWAVGEWVRGVVFTGFPWNLIGYAWTAWLPVVQTAAWVGVHGLGLLTVLAASAPWLLGRPDVSRRIAVGATVAGIGLFVALAAAGAVRLAVNPTVPTERAVRIVQPNTGNLLSPTHDQVVDAFRRVLRLQADPPPGAVIVWPETAVPALIDRDPEALRLVGSVTPAGGYTVAATPRVVTDADGRRRIHNSVLAVDPEGRVVETYDKAHLVPFGEYVPFRWLFPGIAAVATGPDEFSPGPGPRTWRLPGVPAVGPLICYEVIFPAAVVDRADRPEWLLNATNDSWYGRTAGPHQHFAITRMRAVEEGVPVVRAALTGISGVIDPLGRVVARLGLDAEGVVDAPLPRPLDGPPLQARAGHLGLVVMLMILALCVPITRHRC